MKSIKSKSPLTVYRYVRPLDFSIERNELIHAPAGGIAFQFDIDPNLNMFKFSYVRCPDTVRFCSTVAKKQLIKKPKYLVLATQKDRSLVDNVDQFLIGSTGELKNLRQHLHQIQKHNKTITAKAQQFYSEVTEKVKVEYELA